jgi:hypothetical protein
MTLAPVETWLAGLDLEDRRWQASELVSFGALYNELGCIAEAARVLYFARRRFPNEVSIYIAFAVSILFKGESPPWMLPPDPVVAPGRAVGLVDERGQELLEGQIYLRDMIKRTGVETESCCHQHVSVCNRLKLLSVSVPHLLVGKSEHGRKVGAR